VRYAIVAALVSTLKSSNYDVLSKHESKSITIKYVRLTKTKSSSVTLDALIDASTNVSTLNATIANALTNGLSNELRLHAIVIHASNGIVLTDVTYGNDALTIPLITNLPSRTIANEITIEHPSQETSAYQRKELSK
jgi:signal transduction histidine kinase